MPSNIFLFLGKENALILLNAFFKLGENSCSRQFSKPCYGANVNERRNTVFEEQYFGIHNKSYLSTRYESIAIYSSSKVIIC